MSHGTGSPGASTHRAYARRAEARERERTLRRSELRRRAHVMAAAVRDRYGAGVRTFLFGSLSDPDLFTLRSDIDLAVQGLTASEYWEAWGPLEKAAGDAGFDLVRMETASESLRELIMRDGEELA